MVVNIATIPLHIQKLIVQKMNFKDFKAFTQSSKHGRNLGNGVRPTINVTEIIIRRENIEIKCRKSSENRLFSEMRRHEGCPRLSSRKIYIVEDLGDDGYLEIINEAEEGWLSSRSSTFCFQVTGPSIKPEVFNHLLEVFKVKHLFTPGLPIDCMQLPAVRKIESMDLYLTMEDSHLLALNCSRFTTHLDSARINQTLNRFFKQWLDEERNIVDVKILDLNSTNKIDPNVMLCDLPFSFLWSPDTHRTSIIAHISYFRLKGRCNFYSIRSENRTLFVKVLPYSVYVREVVNEQQELLKELQN